MKYLFVIYTDLQYKEHLDYFKKQEFYKEISDNPNIEVIEWGADYHTEYNKLPSKTQEMMKWCSENKEYDYLIKCDDTIFNDTWDFYKSRLGKERDGYRYTCDRWGDKSWSVVDEDDNKHYWGLNYIRVSPDEFKIYFDNHYGEGYEYNLNFIDTYFHFFEGKYYMVSKEFSIFIGEQESFSKEMCKELPLEDVMVGHLAKGFK
mgnify:FL=1|tara:strand:+ start:1418 stop:2029 length:612 start_codon:yes stop_codon:yes gene_type:complete